MRCTCAIRSCAFCCGAFRGCSKTTVPGRRWPMHPVVLDFDGSVSLPDAQVIDLRERQEAIRFGCSKHELDSLDAALPESLGLDPAPVFFGSGDFHHVSYPLIR